MKEKKCNKNVGKPFNKPQRYGKKEQYVDRKDLSEDLKVKERKSDRKVGKTGLQSVDLKKKERMNDRKEGMSFWNISMKKKRK